MSRDNETKTVRVSAFDGDVASFQTWWTRFRAHAKIAGFSTAIGIDPETDAPSSQNDVDGLAGDTTENKKKLVTVGRNDEAMASLTLAFTTDEITSIMMNAQSNEWPDGLVCEVVNQLLETRKPEGIMSLVDEKIALHKIKMGQNEDPVKLFDRIRAVETRFNTKSKR